MLIVGGQQKKAFSAPNEEHTRFAKAVCASYPFRSCNGELLISHVTPDHLAAPTEDRSVLFKSASISDGQLLACTQTEILAYSLNSYELQNTISLPHFNDVHHVIKTVSGSYLVACTGLDMVFELDPTTGQKIREWDTLKRSVWTKHNEDKDYRLVLTTKPHDSHPNFVFQYKDEYWVTRFEQRDAICLNNDRRIDIGIEKPHDGHILGKNVYFTTVDGHVVIANMETTEIVDVIDLHECKNAGTATGWARGLKLIDEDRVIVGFSTLRVTKFRENVRWIKRRLGKLDQGKPEPTHVAMYDLKKRELIWRAHLTNPQIDVVFSVL
jgi:hypothetical protein